ncbi:alpha/beta hydrolase family protein [Mycolicibacterium frederiksbergense]|uniref:alpha/beta hydrolase family protein n=1 Tax=Mycolicibacterium frederiksbergense TaxID=117567 RepID=UPI003999B66A
MSHFSAWMGAGVVTAGVSAAMIIGADVASAETGPDSSPDSTASSSDGDRTRPSSSQDASENDASEKDPGTDSDGGIDGAGGIDRDDAGGIDDDDAHDESALDADETPNDIDIATGAANGRDADDTAGSDRSAIESPKPDVNDLDAKTPLVSEAEEDALPLGEGPAFVESHSDGNDTAAKPQAAKVTPAAATTLAAAIAPAASTTAAVAPQRTLQDIIASFIFDFVGVAVTFIAGPPVVPRGSSVTVKTSTLKIDDQHTVPAHWYYPKGDEPPQRIIYLQHGFLGVGAMYSYTAANLAETTNSIVVVPTLTSNRNVADGFWLGSDQALRATSALFLGDREALTDSAIAAGYAQRYGAEVALPERFALVGHSLGGNLVAGAAGYYADAVAAGGVTNQLAGVVLLDAAPQGSVLSDALVKLDGVGTYIPVFELGAPKEFRRVDADLTEHRPGKFNGLVLENGKHLDSMDGGTWLIQFVSHVYQGFPAAQNQAAAQMIIGGWVGDILDGRIDPLTGRCDGDECAGVYGDLGQTVDLDTPAGPTRGAVIGVPLPVRSTEFQPESVTAMVAPRLAASRALLLRT